MTVAEDFRAALQNAGRPMTLKRRIGGGVTFHETSVWGKTTDFQPTEVVGAVRVGDRRVRISALSLTPGWAGSSGDAPKSGDILDGATLQGPPEPLRDGRVIVGYKCWTRGT